MRHLEHLAPWVGSRTRLDEFAEGVVQAGGRGGGHACVEPWGSTCDSHSTCVTTHINAAGRMRETQLPPKPGGVQPRHAFPHRTLQRPHTTTSLRQQTQHAYSRRGPRGCTRTATTHSVRGRVGCASNQRCSRAHQHRRCRRTLTPCHAGDSPADHRAGRYATHGHSGSTARRRSHTAAHTRRAAQGRQASGRQGEGSGAKINAK